MKTESSRLEPAPDVWAEFCPPATWWRRWSPNEATKIIHVWEAENGRLILLEKWINGWRLASPNLHDFEEAAAVAARLAAGFYVYGERRREATGEQ